MEKNKTNSVMVTIIYLKRRELITKDAMEKYCKGEEIEKVSVNDDLETFFEDLRLGKEPNRSAPIYFLPKLTNEEVELVERKDRSYLETLNWPNLNVLKISSTSGFRKFGLAGKSKFSESDSDFVRGNGYRETFIIENKSLQNTSKWYNLQ